MNEQIAITFGNDKILSEIKANHPDRDLRVFQALNQNDKLMMLDYSGNHLYSSHRCYTMC